MFVRIASRYRCEVWVEKEGEQVNGKSIMGLMMLAAGQGSKLRVRCEGPDADQALQEIEELISREVQRGLSLTGLASLVSALHRARTRAWHAGRNAFKASRVSPGIARGTIHVVRSRIGRR